MPKKPRVFYGWYIVGVMIIAMMLVYGIRTSFSAFFPHILDEFHWFRGSTAVMLSLNIFIYGLAAPVAGTLVDRWKPRAVVVIGIFLLALSTALCYFARELWHFYILFGVLAPIGSAFCGSPVLNTAIINWFGKRRGLAGGRGPGGGGPGFGFRLLRLAGPQYRHHQLVRQAAGSGGGAGPDRGRPELRLRLAHRVGEHPGAMGIFVLRDGRPGVSCDTAALSR